MIGNCLRWLVGLGVGVCIGCAGAEDADDRSGSFPCGDEECDVVAEICMYPENCSGGDEEAPPPPVCQEAPSVCDGRTTSECLNQGGRICDPDEAGGFTCSFACG